MGYYWKARGWLRRGWGIKEGAGYTPRVTVVVPTYNGQHGGQG
ncbi:hypothetical protein [Pyrobaculum sp.]